MVVAAGSSRGDNKYKRIGQDLKERLWSGTIRSWLTCLHIGTCMMSQFFVQCKLKPISSGSG